ASHAWIKKSNIHPETEGFIFAIQDRVINTRNDKKHICGLQMNLAVKFNLLKDTQPHYIYKPESCLENDNYKLYFDRTVLTDIH
ncbi:unnamed protein product, partial [Tenebrio molitor]